MSRLFGTSDTGALNASESDDDGVRVTHSTTPRTYFQISLTIDRTISWMLSIGIVSFNDVSVEINHTEQRTRIPTYSSNAEACRK